MEAENYIQLFCLEYLSLKESYFQFKFAHVSIDRVLWSDILCYYQRLRSGMNYQEHSIDIYKRRKENNPLVERPVIEGIRSKKKKREEF